jgi:Potential Queuosine, Q, salvage protein family
MVDSTVTRRSFVSALSGAALVPKGRTMRTPPSDHPILSTVAPVIASARHLRLDEDRIRDVASWMAYEDLSWPDFRSPLHPEANDADTMDFIFLTSTINFAFTDFEKHVMFKVDYAGAERSDSDAMEACLKRALDRGVPILEGSYLANIQLAELEEIFEGNIVMPMLGERLAIFHEVGRVLKDRYEGRFHRFVREAPHRLYHNGKGLLERLLSEFPSFRDESDYRGHLVSFQKRAQLLFWVLHARFRDGGFFRLEDPEKLTVFADYIVPVALRLFRITSYGAELEAAINARRILPAGSEEEVEIRAFTLWVMHLLTRAINDLRPKERQVIEPVVDGRIWTHYHTTHWPHHLTVTTAY